jgi:hypothetical protein
VEHDFLTCECEVCSGLRDDLTDKWVDEQPEREQRRMEQLEGQGYYDTIEVG